MADLKIDIKVELDALNKRLESLDIMKQKEAIERGLKISARPILQKAESNFNVVKKNTSKTNYSSFREVTGIKVKKGISNRISVFVGLFGRGTYKYRWVNWGTSVRYVGGKTKNRKSETNDSQYRGLVKQTNFFYRAVEQTKEQVSNSIIKNINDIIDKLIKKESIK